MTEEFLPHFYTVGCDLIPPRGIFFCNIAQVPIIAWCNRTHKVLHGKGGDSQIVGLIFRHIDKKSIFILYRFFYSDFFQNPCLRLMYRNPIIPIQAGKFSWRHVADVGMEHSTQGCERGALAAEEA